MQTLPNYEGKTLGWNMEVRQVLVTFNRLQKGYRVVQKFRELRRNYVFDLDKELANNFYDCK